jgi:hypothetical protein
MIGIPLNVLTSPRKPILISTSAFVDITIEPELGQSQIVAKLDKIIRSKLSLFDNVNI